MVLFPSLAGFIWQGDAWRRAGQEAQWKVSLWCLEPCWPHMAGRRPGGDRAGAAVRAFAPVLPGLEGRPGAEGTQDLDVAAPEEGLEWKYEPGVMEEGASCRRQHAVHLLRKS